MTARTPDRPPSGRPSPRLTSVRVAQPFLHTFRAAHAAGDARQPVERPARNGDREIVGRGGARAQLSVREMEEAVRLDVQSLLNTTHLAADQSLDGLDHVATAILNFGLPDISRYSLDDERCTDIATAIISAIRTHEPRLNPRTVTASRVPDTESGLFTLRFSISADLMLSPEAVPLTFVAEIDPSVCAVILKRSS